MRHGSLHRKIRVGVLMGGPSSEHSVSLRSGGNVMKNLDKEKYIPHGVIISKGGNWPESPQALKDKIDIAFIAMHGPYGEDGTVQSILDEVGLPYTGSTALPSALAMNKFLSLRFLRELGMRVPTTLIFSKSDWLYNPAEVIKKIELNVQFPLILKPNQNGSSIGVSVINPGQKIRLFEELQNIFESGSQELIVQPFIEGKEFTCAILDHGVSRTAYALPPTEIVPLRSNFFDYNAKYSLDSSVEITPAPVSPAWLQTIKRTALFIHKAMGLRGMSRTDMILGKDGKIYVLEVNTIPGMTDTSLLPKAAQVVGINFPELLHRIISASYLSFYSRT